MGTLKKNVCLRRYVIATEPSTAVFQSNLIYVHSVILHHSLSQSEFATGTWEENFEEINFADFKFEITHHFLKQEHVKSNNKEEPEEGIVIHVLF